MTTMAVSKDYVPKLAKMKKEDKEGKMKTLKNIVVFEQDTPADDL